MLHGDGTKLTVHPRPADALYWSAAPVVDGDFGPEDPLALDYIGQQIGNWLLPTLTTRTSRAQTYAVVLYGLDLAERARVKFGLPADDGVRIKLFERWERFWCLSVLESRKGAIERGDPDAMRGIRGARRAWFTGDGDLPLDFPLLSRQSELGSLGAYLSSLRASGLVKPGTVEPTEGGRKILQALWAEPEDHANVWAFDAYALGALDPERKKLHRKDAKVGLQGVGKRTRLTCLSDRKEQQKRLYEALFGDARGATTSALAKLVEKAVTQHGAADPRTFFKDAAEGNYGPVTDELTEHLRLAWAFSTAAKRWLDAFNAVYHEAWTVGLLPRARAEARVAEHLPGLAAASKALLGEPGALRVKALPAHGKGFHELATCGATESVPVVLEQILAFHGRVQSDRRGAKGWLRLEGDHLVVDLASYTGHRAEARYPSLKFEVVRSLLRDLGRVS